MLARLRDGEEAAVEAGVAAKGIRDLFIEFPPSSSKGDELQQANFSVGLTASGDIYVSKVGGMATETAYLQKIRTHLESNKYHVGRNIKFAGKFNTAYTSGNHAEMCILAAARADGQTLSVIYCSGPHCAFCAAMMTKAGVTLGAATGDDRQSGWAHPFAPIFLGSSVSEDTASQLKALKSLDLEPSATDAAKQGITWRPTAPKPRGGKHWA